MNTSSSRTKDIYLQEFPNLDFLWEIVEKRVDHCNWRGQQPKLVHLKKGASIPIDFKNDSLTVKG